MARAYEQAVDIGLFHHLAGIHDDDALRGLGHDAHGVGDQHDRHAEAFLHVLQEVEDLRLDRYVERGGRLVGDDELGLAGHRHRDQLQDRHRGDGLAAAGLADHAERLALVERDVDAVDRLQHAVVGSEVGLQALDLEQRRHQITRLASSASRIPSPMKLMATTATKIAPPGNSAQWAAMSRKSLASNSSRPQVGTSGGKPRPRKDKVDSAMMAAATSMVPAMITGPSALGRM